MLHPEPLLLLPGLLFGPATLTEVPAANDRYHHRMRRVAGGLLFSGMIVGLLAGCAEGPVPLYVRLAGPAPSIADAPPSRAHLVVFWATWCPPCRTEAPSLRALADAPPRDVVVVVFSHDQTSQDVHRFFGGPPPPSWHLRPDPDTRIATAFGVEALPASILVVDGRLAARFAGARDWNSKEMRRLLARLVAEPAR